MMQSFPHWVLKSYKQLILFYYREKSRARKKCGRNRSDSEKALLRASMIRDFSGISHGSESLQKKSPKRREAGTWLKPRRYEKEIYLLERLALETCFQKCFAVSGLFIEKQWRLFFTSFVVDKISIRENCDQNVYTG